MGNGIHKLTAKAVENAKPKNGKATNLGDGGGLFLQISATGTKSWSYRYRDATKRLREYGLGSVLTLAEARIEAAKLRRQVAQGVDVIAARKTARATTMATKTFRECTAGYVDDMKSRWVPKHAVQWLASMDTHVHPRIGDMSVQAIDTPAVLRVLRPIWTTVPVSAGHIQRRIAAVLSWATANGYRVGDNPAVWDVLKFALPAPTTIATITPRKSLPWADLPAFMADLRSRPLHPAALAIEWTILCAVRTGDTVGAKWSEIDFDAKVWTIPADRQLKARKKEHRVPLSDAAIVVLQKAQAIRSSDLVFNIAGSSMLEFLRGPMKQSDIDVHGFRSTFKSWGGDHGHSREVIEMCLAHTIGNRTEQAYNRTDYLGRRRAVMQLWADHCAGTVGAEVIPLHGVRA